MISSASDTLDSLLTRRPLTAVRSALRFNFPGPDFVFDSGMRAGTTLLVLPAGILVAM